MEPHGGAGYLLHTTHTHTSTHTLISTHTQTDISFNCCRRQSVCLEFSPWFNSATGHHLIIIISACGLYGLLLSNHLRNSLHLRVVRACVLLKVHTCVCVHVECVCRGYNQSWVWAQPGFCGVCSSLPCRGTVNTALLPLTPSMP